MEYPSAMTFELYTPFILPEELFKGFEVTRKEVSYTRNGLGIPMNPCSYKRIPERINTYNDYINSITPKVNIKALSIKPICVYSEDFVEHIDFEVIVNRYSVTPTDSLTYESLYAFIKNINETLPQVKDHPLKDFFVRTGSEDAFHRYGFQIDIFTFISLPDIYIPVTDTEISEKYILEAIRYMDALKEYYRQNRNERTKSEDHKWSRTTWNSVCPGWGTAANKSVSTSTTDRHITVPYWDDESEEETVMPIPEWSDSEEENA